MSKQEHFTPKAMPPEIKLRDNAALRTMEPGDAARIQEILQADPEIRNRVIWTNTLHTEDRTARMISMRSKSTDMYAITIEDVVSGYLGLWEDDKGYFDHIPHPHEYGFGYFIHPDLRGQGLVTDAARALMEAAEETFDVRNWAVYVEDNNPDSQAVLQRLEFTPVEGDEGLFREPRTGVMERKWEKAPGE